MGTYQVSGERLVMRNSLDGKTFGDYRMRWEPASGVLQLDDGEWTLRLHLVTGDACGEGQRR